MGGVFLRVNNPTVPQNAEGDIAALKSDPECSFAKSFSDTDM